jgi:adenylate cyclase
LRTSKERSCGSRKKYQSRSARLASSEYPQSYRSLTAALGQLGRIDEAKQALHKAIAAVFDMFVRQGVPGIRPQDQAHMVEGLHKADWRG